MSRIPLHIIVDGADGTGKSTVVQILSRHFNLPVIRMPLSQDKVRTDMIEPMSKMFNETVLQFHESSFIQDRGFPSSIVYSKIFKRTDNLDYINNIEQILNPKVVILTTIGGNALRDDDIYSKEEVSEIDRAYYELASKNLNYILIHVANKSLAEVVNEILQRLEN